MVVKRHRKSELVILDAYMQRAKEVEAQVTSIVNKIRNSVVTLKQRFFLISVAEAERKLTMRRRKELGKKRRRRQEECQLIGANRISNTLVGCDIMEKSSQHSVQLFSINTLNKLDHTRLQKRDQRALQYMLEHKHFAPRLEVCASVKVFTNTFV